MVVDCSLAAMEIPPPTPLRDVMIVCAIEHYFGSPYAPGERMAHLQ